MKFITSDDCEFVVEENIVNLSKTLTRMCQIVPPDPSDDDRPIPLQNLIGTTFDLIIKWCRMYLSEKKKNTAKSDSNDDTSMPSCELEKWEQSFLSVDQFTLFNILMGANYLEIKPLISSCAKFIASSIKGKSSEEMRKFFNITNDFTPEEEEQIQKEQQQWGSHW